MKTYEIFAGEELVIAEKVQQRRYQILIHSCIYYYLNQSSISDKQWDEWAKELMCLQTQYPEISKRVTLYEYFKDWDASTGAFLPITLDWVVNIANKLLVNDTLVQNKPKKKVEKRRLF